MLHSGIVAATRCWVERFVVGMNFCPFAGPVLRMDRLRFAVSEARNTEALWQDLLNELSFLVESNPEDCETTLLVHPWVLTDFEVYLDFLVSAETLLAEAGLEGEIQLASFHPHYRFEGEDPESVSHYTNRSPFPMLHLLREDSISEAVDSHPDVASIPLRNMATLQGKSLAEIEKMRQVCLDFAS
jgi:hypothetical protein